MHNTHVSRMFLSCLVAVSGAAIARTPMSETHYLCPADAGGLRSSYNICLDNSGGVTVKMLDCDDDELSYQDARLNKVYKKLFSSLSNSQKMVLRSDEKKWMAFRDSACRPDPDGGTAASVTSKSCYVDETARQATRLEQRSFVMSLRG